jgi:hypothetical protein
MSRQVGILIVGKDYCNVGMDEAERDANLDKRIAFIERFNLYVGGSLTTDSVEAYISYPTRNVSLETWKSFELHYRSEFPTFDGHIMLTDVNHVTQDDRSMLDWLDSAGSVE